MAASQTLKKVSQRQEQKLATKLGGQAQKASGALPWAKGDVRVRGKLRLEAKYTYANSYRLTLADLQKISYEVGANEKSVFVVEFKEKASKRTIISVAFIRHEDYLEAVRLDKNWELTCYTDSTVVTTKMAYMVFLDEINAVLERTKGGSKGIPLGYITIQGTRWVQLLYTDWERLFHASSNNR